MSGFRYTGTLRPVPVYCTEATRIGALGITAAYRQPYAQYSNSRNVTTYTTQLNGHICYNLTNVITPRALTGEGRRRGKLPSSKLLLYQFHFLKRLFSVGVVICSIDVLISGEETQWYTASATTAVIALLSSSNFLVLYLSVHFVFI